MRRILIVLALGLTAYTVVTGRRAAGQAKKNWKRTDRERAVKSAVRQKPGQIKVPKIPKIKRAK